MPLLCEFAITPDVFDVSSYSSEEVAEVRFEQLKDRLIEDSLVRNLRNGAWLNYIVNSMRTFNNQSKDLIVWLKTHNRLRDCPVQITDFDDSEKAWIEEALASHNSDPLNGIICSSEIAAQFSGNDHISGLKELRAAKWWSKKTNSVVLEKNSANYILHLSPILKYANSIMIIDQYLDPLRPQFGSVIDLLKQLKGRNPMPPVEIHRVNHISSGPATEIIENTKWQNDFCRKMKHLVDDFGLEIEVFLWDRMHDRQIITDIAGFLLGNSLDTTTDPRIPVTWSRMSSDDRNYWQKFYDPAVRADNLIYRFKIE
jgi:hypothetical protein